MWRFLTTPIARHFLRFRHFAPANQLIFETSPDASVWTERARGDLGERRVSAAPDATRVNMAYSQFLLDRAQLVAGPDLPATTLALAERFVLRAPFRATYPSAFSAAQYVNKLFDTAGLTGTQFDAARQAEITAMQTQGRVLLNVANNSVLQQREYNPSFVLMQYFGYLRRDPDQAGYDFWLGILNQQPANLRGMVCAFITAQEYQERFSPVSTRTNALCAGNP